MQSLEVFVGSFTSTSLSENASLGQKNERESCFSVVKSGWDPLSADGRQVVWHVRSTWDPDPVIREPSAGVRPCWVERCRKPERNTRVGWMPKEKLPILVQSMTPQSQKERHVLLDTFASTTAWTLNELQKVPDPRLKSTVGRFG